MRIFQDEGNHSILMELELQKANIQSHLIKPDRDVMHTIQYTISDNIGNSITFELMETGCTIHVNGKYRYQMINGQ